MAHPDKRARWSTTTFLLAFAATLFLLAWISLEFLMPLVLAASGAILLSGFNEWLIRRLHGRRGLASLITSILTFVVIIGPLTYIVIRMVQELVPFVSQLARNFGSGRLSTMLMGLVPERYRGSIDLGALQNELKARLATLAAAVTAFAAGLPGRIANVLIDAFVAFIALFAYLARGPQMVDAIIEATPMERRHTRRLLHTTADAIRTVFAASFITAVIQFGLGWLGFVMVGVPYALPLSAVMAFFSFVFSLVPVLGSGLVWVPVGVALLFTGHPISGVFILGWGAFVLGSVDNVVKPLYAKGALQLSPLLVFVTLFGGISVFGPIGAILGPLVAALAASFLRIWTTEFLQDSKPLPHALHQGQPRRRPGLLARLRDRHA